MQPQVGSGTRRDRVVDLMRAAQRLRFKGPLGLVTAALVAYLTFRALSRPESAHAALEVRWRHFREAAQTARPLRPRIELPRKPSRESLSRVRTLAHAVNMGLCEHAARCPSAYSADTELCLLFLERRQLLEMAALNAAEEAGEVVLDPDVAGEVLTNNEKSPCDAPQKSVLEEALRGSRKVGQACLSPWSCETGLVCQHWTRSRFGESARARGVCEPTRITDLPFGAPCGDGSKGACVASTYCSRDTQRCNRSLATGESCTEDQECATKWCYDSVCTSLLPEGAQCGRTPGRCQGPLLCEQEICTPIPDLGQLCTRKSGNMTCRGDLACFPTQKESDLGVCLLRRQEGETCSSAMDCLSGVCKGSVCADPYWPRWVPIGLRRVPIRLDDLWHALSSS